MRNTDESGEVSGCRATGEVGDRLANRLAKLGVEQHLIVRDPESCTWLLSVA